ncbi:GTP-binding protein [Chlamydia abortus]|nr:GTP-binding protein [Chlamydia abortus]
MRLLSPRAVVISAKTGEGIQNLLEAMTDIITEGFPQVTLKFSYKDYGKFTELYDAGLVVAHRRKEDILIVDAYLPEELGKKYQQFIMRKRPSPKPIEDEFCV